MASTQQIAILGGGQLGRMLALAAVPLGLAVHVLDPAGPECPAAIAATSAIKGDFKKKDEVLAFVEKVRPDVLTVEIEHVDVDALEAVQSKCKIAVQPEPATIRVIQDKLLQKQHLSAHGLAVPRYKAVSGVDDIKAVFDDYGSQLVLKSRTLAYDGRGNAVVKDIQNVHAALKSLVSAEVYVEEFVEFEMELAVMVARSTKGELVSHPCVQTIQKDSICHTVIAPAQVDGPIAAKARELAEAAVATLKGAGIFGVELFMLKNGSLLINEIAPRVHNSGHYTIEACHTSQFEQHLRAILGLPLGDASMRVPAAVMLNILGNGTLGQTFEPCMRSLRVPGASMHWYNKGEARAGRKMGHITVTGATMEQVFERLHQITLVDNRVSPSLPQVGIIMGSDSDLPVMSAAAKVLTDFKVPFEIHVVSAHRTPRRMFEYASTAHKRSLKVIIAGAGGAAHLPGMVASLTPLPVIGVPVPLKHLDGVDSLYSIVQMPRGVPVAAVAIDNAANAGLLAVRMLGAFEPELLQQMVEYQKRLEDDVLNKDQKLQDVGWQAYK